MKGILQKRTAPNVARFMLICMLFATRVFAQEPATELNSEALSSHLQTQLELLESPDFRTRELASWRLQRYPSAAIDLIATAAPQASVNSASQQIALLDLFLSRSEPEIKAAAYDTLKKFSLTKTSALASLAANSVKAIEDAYEVQAFEILQHAGANVGYLDLNINGARRISRRADILGLEVKSEVYRGDSESLTWIRYLKSIEVVSLEGAIITPALLALVAQMPKVRKILLRGTYIRPGVYAHTLKPEDLLALNKIPAIEHLEINYLSIDDSFIPVLCQLPITESLRLFGTAISSAGKDEIARRLDGLEIYRGNGGFLGIGSNVSGPVVVNTVTDNSAAANAGIQLGDVITEIEGQPIKDFAALRATIAQYSPNEMILIKLIRPKDPTARQQLGHFELQLFAVLNEQAN